MSVGIRFGVLIQRPVESYIPSDHCFTIIAVADTVFTVALVLDVGSSLLYHPRHTVAYPGTTVRSITPEFQYTWWLSVQRGTISVDVVFGIRLPDLVRHQAYPVYLYLEVQMVPVLRVRAYTKHNSV